MQLDYSQIKSGQVKQPVLRLRTLAGKELGAISYVHNLSFEINYSDVSTIQFDVPLQSNGMLNPLYAYLCSYKVVYTDNYGIYVLVSPEKKGDGVKEIKTVYGYSLEKLFERKKLYLEGGTFNFWNPDTPEDTILYRILELDSTWSVGYVDASLIDCYRTFDEYNSDALSFCYNDAMDKYHCVIVFDVYNKTINAYDASESRGTLPIYLSYENLVESVDVKELSDDIVTKLKVYGADDLSIRNVNPIGTDYIVDLSYFISNGDLDITPSGSTMTLAEKVTEWQKEVVNRQAYYTNLVSARASKTAQKLERQAYLADLEAEMDALLAQQSVIVQALAMETTSSGKATQQANLDQVNADIDEKNEEIELAESQIEGFVNEETEYAEMISAIVAELSFSGYFTEEEQELLGQYMIEDELQEETFVATSVDATASGSSSAFSGNIIISDADIVRTSPSGTKNVYSIFNGKLVLGDSDVVSDIIRATLEQKTSDVSYVLTAYLGATTIGEKSYDSGMLTISGNYLQFINDITEQSTDGVTEYKGSTITARTENGKRYFTVSVTDYQKYSVAQELYEYGCDSLSEMIWPVFEFTLDSANFLFQKEFAAFKDKLELGKAIHLRVASDGIVDANLIGVSLNFEDISDFKLTFSNQYRLKNGAETLSDVLRKASASSRSFNANKYLYNQTASAATQISNYMNTTLNAATQKIVAANNQSVTIGGAGISVGGDSDYQLRIIDSMIAMTDDNWKTAKLAIGLFATEETGTQWGVNAELVAGKLYIGNSLVLENQQYDENNLPTGIMQFKVDATGAWLYNSTMTFQHDDGGMLLIDPKYGIVAGKAGLYTTSGTTVSPSFIDEDGELVLDDTGMPEDANFFLDLRDGSAYFRGTVTATAGKIGGWTVDDDFLYGGSNSSYVALNGSKSNTYSAYAIWAGAEKPTSAPFSVKKDGTLYASSATISGDLYAPRLIGSLTAGDDSEDGWLEGCGINVNDGAFYVDKKGNVKMNGSIELAGNITWSSTNSPCQALFARLMYSTPTKKYVNYPSSYSSGWHRTLDTSDYYASYTYDGGVTWTDAILIRGTDGEDGSDASVTRSNIYRAMLSALSSDGLYSKNGALLINATAIKTGTIDAGQVYLENNYGGFGCATGHDGTNVTYGAKMYGSDESYYVITTNKGVRLQAKENGLTVTAGRIVADVEIETSSDKRLKNNISYDMSKYDRFYMALSPCFYRYNSGQSGRYHIGFVAQDVEAALEKNGITTGDFAGLVKTAGENDAHKIFTDEYSLRYNEFIALNTYMVQKLMRKVEALEAKIEELSAPEQ